MIYDKRCRCKYLKKNNIVCRETRTHYLNLDSYMLYPNGLAGHSEINTFHNVCKSKISFTELYEFIRHIHECQFNFVYLYHKLFTILPQRLYSYGHMHQLQTRFHPLNTMSIASVQWRCSKHINANKALNPNNAATPVK